MMLLQVLKLAPLLISHSHKLFTVANGLEMLILIGTHPPLALTTISSSGTLIILQFKLAKESHPVTKLVKLAVCDPAVEKVNPFQSKGSSELHTVVSVSLVKVGFTSKFKVAIESHPVTVLWSVTVLVPDSVS